MTVEIVMTSQALPDENFNGVGKKIAKNITDIGESN